MPALKVFPSTKVQPGVMSPTTRQSTALVFNDPIFITEKAGDVKQGRRDTTARVLMEKLSDKRLGTELVAIVDSSSAAFPRSKSSGKCSTAGSLQTLTSYTTAWRGTAYFQNMEVHATTRA